MPDDALAPEKAVLRSKGRIAGIGCLLLAAVYFLFCLGDFLSSHYAERADLPSLQRSVRLSPSNAENRRRLGNLLQIQGQIDSARFSLEEAARLDPHDARIHLDLARIYQILNDPQQQEKSLERALLAAPTKPGVAWEAGNFFLLRGERDKALRSFRVVLASDASTRGAALELAWRIAPDADRLIRDMLPPHPDAYGQLLEELISLKENTAAARVWTGLVQLALPFPPRTGLLYVNYLIREHQPEAAKQAWEQMAPLCGLSAYLPSTNLIVNPRFEHEVLNSGFDWHYLTLPNVRLTLDPAEYRRSNHSLLATFEGQGVTEVGLAQFLVLEPKTPYQFSVHFKTDDLQGAGGPVFVIRDEATGAELLTTEDLRNPGSWRELTGHFETGPETKLVSLRLLRIPAGNAIRGHLWIDEVQLVRIDHAEDGQQK